MEIEHIKCSCCKSWRTVDLFLNNSGRRLKTCKKCRDRKKKYNQKPEVKEKIRLYNQKPESKERKRLYHKEKVKCELCGTSSRRDGQKFHRKQPYHIFRMVMKELLETV